LREEISSYDDSIKTVLADKTDQTPAENKAAIDRNNKSYDLATKREKATKARGAENQAVKSKLIW